MLNPYKAPAGDLGYAPFRTRLRRAFKRALREYRQGLIRENMSARDHIRAWMSVFLICGIALVATFWFIIVLLLRFGVIS